MFSFLLSMTITEKAAVTPWGPESGCGIFEMSRLVYCMLSHRIWLGRSLLDPTFFLAEGSASTKLSGFISTAGALSIERSEISFPSYPIPSHPSPTFKFERSKPLYGNLKQTKVDLLDKSG